MSVYHTSSSSSPPESPVAIMRPYHARYSPVPDRKRLCRKNSISGSTTSFDSTTDESLLDPLLSSPKSVTIFCDKCGKRMNNNYYYMANEQGIIEVLVCPQCYMKVSHQYRYRKYTFEEPLRRPTIAPVPPEIPPPCPYSCIIS